MPCFILDNCSIARKDEKGKMVCPVSDKKYTSSYFKKHKQTKQHQDNIVKLANEIVLSEGDTDIDKDDNEYETA